MMETPPPTEKEIEETPAPETAPPTDRPVGTDQPVVTNEPYEPEPTSAPTDENTEKPAVVETVPPTMDKTDMPVETERPVEPETTSAPTDDPVPTDDGYEHLGCFMDSKADRVLGHRKDSPDMIPQVSVTKYSRMLRRVEVEDVFLVVLVMGALDRQDLDLHV